MSSLREWPVFVLQDFKRVDDSCTGLTGLNDVIHIAAFGSLERVSESALVIGSLFFNVLATEDNLDSALGTHDSYLCGWPSVVEVSLQVFAGHDIVRASISLSRHKGDLRYGCLSVGVQKLGAMLDNSTEFLGCAGQEPWDISEGDDGDLESVTEADETRRLDRGVDVQAASEHLRLVGDNSADATFDLREASDHVLGVSGHDLIEVVPVTDALNDGKHVVGLVGVMWYDIVKELGRGLVLAVE